MRAKRTIYTIYLKNGQKVILKGTSSTRDQRGNTFEIYQDKDKHDIAARFELSEVAGVAFDKEC